MLHCLCLRMWALIVDAAASSHTIKPMFYSSNYAVIKPDNELFIQIMCCREETSTKCWRGCPPHWLRDFKEGDKVMQWLALLPHGRKAVGLIPGWVVLFQYLLAVQETQIRSKQEEVTCTFLLLHYYGGGCSVDTPTCICSNQPLFVHLNMITFYL